MKEKTQIVFCGERLMRVQSGFLRETIYPQKIYVSIGIYMHECILSLLLSGDGTQGLVYSRLVLYHRTTLLDL